MAEVRICIITLLSKHHLNKKRYSVSIEATNKDKACSTIERRKEEKQEYIEDDVMSGGGRSPEIEVHLYKGRCNIQILISGALKPAAKLEKGEDVLEFNDAQEECRKFLNLVPTYDGSGEDTATIKFKVGDEIKHTVHIHEIPTEKRQELNCSTSSAGSACSSVSDASFRTAGESMVVTGSASDFSGDSTINIGSVRETKASTSGGATSGRYVRADPVPPDPSDLNDAVGGMRLGDDECGPTVVPPEDRAYDNVLLDESLLALVNGLPPNDASMLLTCLQVPSHVQSQSRVNNHTSIVSANFTSLKHWKSKKTSRKDMPDTTNQQLYEDLIRALDDIGRRDIVRKIKQKLEMNKKLEHDDFSNL